jgi:mRNA-degrading endonuclease RelE of RelBE toxin-antitoxin system
MARGRRFWTLKVHEYVLPTLEAFPRPLRTRLWNAIRLLGRNPFPNDHHPLILSNPGRENLYYVVREHCHISYAVEDEKREVIILDILVLPPSSP